MTSLMTALFILCGVSLLGVRSLHEEDVHQQRAVRATLPVPRRPGAGHRCFTSDALLVTMLHVSY